MGVHGEGVYMKGFLSGFGKSNVVISTKNCDVDFRKISEFFKYTFLWQL